MEGARILGFLPWLHISHLITKVCPGPGDPAQKFLVFLRHTQIGESQVWIWRSSSSRSFPSERLRGPLKDSCWRVLCRPLCFGKIHPLATARRPARKWAVIQRSLWRGVLGTEEAGTGQDLQGLVTVSVCHPGRFQEGLWMMPRGLVQALRNLKMGHHGSRQDDVYQLLKQGGGLKQPFFSPEELASYMVITLFSNKISLKL